MKKGSSCARSDVTSSTLVFFRFDDVHLLHRKIKFDLICFIDRRSKGFCIKESIIRIIMFYIDIFVSNKSFKYSLCFNCGIRIHCFH